MLNWVISIVWNGSLLVRVYMERFGRFKSQNVVTHLQQAKIQPSFQKYSQKAKWSNQIFAATTLLKVAYFSCFAAKKTKYPALFQNLRVRVRNLLVRDRYGQNFQHAQVSSACTWDEKHPMTVRSCTGSFWSKFMLRLRLSSLYEVGLKRMKLVLTFKVKIFVNTGLWNCKVIQTTYFVGTPLLQKEKLTELWLKKLIIVFQEFMKVYWSAVGNNIGVIKNCKVKFFWKCFRLGKTAC